MFAKPNWFCAKSLEHRVRPANWRGWLYVTGAVLIAVLPVLVFLGRHQGLEALIWLAAVAAFVAYDLWQVRRVLLGHCAVRSSAPPSDEALSPTVYQAPVADDGIYFLDQRTGQQPVNTTRFQLSLKQ